MLLNPTLRGCAAAAVGCSFSAANACRLNTVRCLSTDIDYSGDPPQPWQLEHVQTRLQMTVPDFFRQRLDYTFYRNDVILDDHIFRLRKQGLHQLMAHFGNLAVAAQFTTPHVEMEAVSCVPVLEDGTVRLRWRIKYVSFARLALDWKLFKRDYRIQNLTWFDGYSVFSVDGNGNVYKVTVQRMVQDDGGRLLENKSPSQKLAEKMGIFSATSQPVFYVPPKEELKKGRK